MTHFSATFLCHLPDNYNPVTTGGTRRHRCCAVCINLTTTTIKNQSFDKKRLPYKFQFTAMEPDESLNSPFEVQPKAVVVNARSVQEFQVTFNPTKDVGNFRTILLASPELSQEEIEIADDPNDLPKKGSLGTIALKLNANTISPELSIDKSNRLDGGK